MPFNFKLTALINKNSINLSEKLISGLGGLLSIFAILVVTRLTVGDTDAALIVASMGASAVLLFAVPHGPLSQPWAVIGGHVVSALIGVTVAQWISHEVLAASVSVGAAITAMYYLRCLHPPGGATALFAVIGGESIYDLGYFYVINPIAINVVTILAIALIFNGLFSWRRYPLVLHKKLKSKNKSTATNTQEAYASISHADFVYALSQIDSFIDVSEYDLLRIYDLATANPVRSNLDSKSLKIGKYYTNGQFGNSWSVRCIVDESPHNDPEKDQLIYKVIAGDNRRTSGVITRNNFAQWAKYEVVRDDENWKKV